MCIGGQPSAPVNKPDYTPDEAHTRFVTKKTDETTGQTEVIQGPKGPAAPTVKTTKDTIRM